MVNKKDYRYKVILTGSTGLLGFALYQKLKDLYEIIPVSRKDFDITDQDATINKIKEIRPDIVIHTAAFTNVDECEIREELAYKTNGLGTYNIASGCLEVDATLVYFSTDYVFDGFRNTPYDELDRPNPINVYARTKLLGEFYVRNLLKKYFIIRTAWLFGPNGRNFVDIILKRAEIEKTLYLVDDQVGCPTFTFDVATILPEIIERKIYGIYHVTNSNFCTRYEFAKKIFSLKNMDINLVPISLLDFPAKAKRPFYSVLENKLLKIVTGKTLRSWQEAITEYLSSKS